MHDKAPGHWLTFKRKTTRELELTSATANRSSSHGPRSPGAGGPSCALLAHGHSSRHSNPSSTATSAARNTDRNPWIFSKTEVKAKSEIRGTLDINFFLPGIATNVTACFFTLPTLPSWRTRGVFLVFIFIFERTGFFCLTNITCLWRTCRKHRKDQDNFKKKAWAHSFSTFG